MFGVRFAAISLVDDNREWFKSAVGIDNVETPRDASLGIHVIRADDLVVTEDAPSDERFELSAMVADPPYIRFYAGVPLRGRDGGAVGVLAVMDRSRRVFTREDRASLKDLAKWAELELFRASDLPPEQAQELERLKADFLASVAHSLRTPLTAIMGFSDLLEGTETDPATTAEYVGIIRNNAEKLNDLLRRVLDPAGGKPPV